MEYAERQLEIYHNMWIFFGIAAMVLLAVAAVMFICFRIPALIGKRRWILIMACVLVLQGGQVSSLNVQAKEAAVQ